VKIDVEGFEGPILRHLLENIDAVGPETEIIVEISPEDITSEFGSVQALLDRFGEAGFGASAIENDYGYRAYAPDAPILAPRQLEQAPADYVDVIFRRPAR